MWSASGHVIVYDSHTLFVLHALFGMQEKKYSNIQNRSTVRATEGGRIIDPLYNILEFQKLHPFFILYVNDMPNEC